MPTTLYAYADGASRGNPGPSGAGWVLQRGTSQPLAAGNLFLGRRTNNEAEYIAAACALQAALDLGFTEVVLRADSELMVRQLLGIYKVRNERLQPLHAKLLALSKQFDQFHAEHVLRARNTLADAQANIAIDEAQARRSPSA